MLSLQAANAPKAIKKWGEGCGRCDAQGACSCQPLGTKLLVSPVVGRGAPCPGSVPLLGTAPFAAPSPAQNMLVNTDYTPRGQTRYLAHVNPTRACCPAAPRLPTPPEEQLPLRLTALLPAHVEHRLLEQLLHRFNFRSLPHAAQQKQMPSLASSVSFWRLLIER